MSERLRLEAEFRDKGVSSGLKKIGTELALIKQTPGMTEAHKWLGAFNERAEGFVREGGGLKAVMAGIGLGGLTAATSVAELVKSFSELGKRQADLRQVSRLTGLTVDEVNRLQRAGERLYIDPARMSAGLQHFASEMHDFGTGLSNLKAELSQFDPDFARKLSLDKPEQQVQDIFAWLSKIRDPVAQQRWTEAFLGDGELRRLLTNGGNDFADALKRAAEHAAKMTPEIRAQADAFHNAVLDFNDDWEATQTKLGTSVLKQMNAVLGEFRALVDNLENPSGKLAEMQDRWAYRGRMLGSTGDFAPADTADAAQARIDKLQAELSGLKNKDDEKSRIRAEEIGLALEKLGTQARGGQGFGRDGNALRKGDEMPASQGWFDGLFQRSAFVTGVGGDSSLSEGVKDGVLAAFREMMAQGDASRAGGSGGLQNASFETPDGSPRRSGSGAGDGGSVDGGGSTAGNLTRLIEEESRRAGIDPRIMEGIRAGESRHRDTYDMKDDAVESSWGPFQLNRRSGLGVQFEKENPGLDLRDPRTIPAQARWVAQYLAKGGSLAPWAGYHGPRDADPRWGNSGYVPRLAPDGGGDPGAPGRAVDLGMSLDGANRDQAARALGARLTPGEWCADFVNGALKASGSKGVNSSIANSFLAWGQEVAKEAAHKGDVLVENRGRGAGMPGGHVGFYTGQQRMRHGHLQFEMLSGNYGGRVNGHDWIDADEVHVRRQLNLPDVARRSGTTEQTVRHQGGASLDINLRGDGTVGSTRARTRGLITAVNLTRGPTMMLPSSTA